MKLGPGSRGGLLREVKMKLGPGSRGGLLREVKMRLLNWDLVEWLRWSL